MSIIGISGRMGSGKDLVGKIIQYLTSECGDLKSSKYRTFDQFIQKGGGSSLRDFDHHYVSKYEIKKFAGKVKQVASLLLNVPLEKWEDQEFKKLQMDPEWGMTYREFLQKIGTDAMRNGLHTNVWVNTLFADYLDEYNPVQGIIQSNWIITDTRFPNELEAIKKRNGITIRVVRTTFRTTETGFGKVSTVIQPEVDKLLGIQEHPSETALDDAKFDYEIINDAGIPELIEKVRTILIKEKII